MRALRVVPVLLLCLVAASCAGQREVRPPGAIRKVVVVSGSRVERLPTGTYRQDMLDESNPRQVLARQAEAVLSERGFEVVATRASEAPLPQTNEVMSFIQQNQAEAAVVIILDWLDVSGAAVMGRADVVLRMGVVGPDGQVKWTDTFRSQPVISVYAAQSDWQSYLRRAAVDAVRAVP
ncbi:hypothetical protein JGU66_16210 [Myxococcaceae bacterium JPH2]|nr:hypothetical protein [Myxococcaceae bacterium JPH2]